ncbi:MAG: hypothetical protein V3T40_05290 [Nitrososphaerales archaeon]
MPFGLFDKKQKCEDCNNSFGTWEELVEHAKSEHKRKVLKCSKCKMEFLQELKRFKHLKEEHRK